MIQALNDEFDDFRVKNSFHLPNYERMNKNSPPWYKYDKSTSDYNMIKKYLLANDYVEAIFKVKDSEDSNVYEILTPMTYSQIFNYQEYENGLSTYFWQEYQSLTNIYVQYVNQNQSQYSNTNEMIKDLQNQVKSLPKGNHLTIVDGN